MRISVRIKKEGGGYCPQVKKGIFGRWEYLRREKAAFDYRYITDSLPEYWNDKKYPQLILSGFILYTNLL